MTSAKKSAGDTQPAIIGLGRMGGNMARRIARAGITVHGYDPSQDARQALADESGVVLHGDLQALVAALPSPRVVWLMLPAGEITSQTLSELETMLDAGDILVDGGNANYLDSQARYQHWHERNIHFVDCGVSGGVWGLQNGYCLMVGGDTPAIDVLRPVMLALAIDRDEGFLHCGASGAGHFTKMIHNGIEYGMMQAFAEGFALLQGREDLHLDLGATAELWRHGSVVRSWLLDLTADTLKNPDRLENIGAVVSDSGEGRWTVDEAVRQGTPAPVIAASLMTRFDSQGKADTTNKLLALMRNAFGGHEVVKKS